MKQGWNRSCFSPSRGTKSRWRWLWCLQWSGWIHFFCESTRSFKCQEIESAFSFRHVHHHHDSHSEEDWNHVMNSKKKKKWRCFCGSSGDCQTLVLTIVGSNPAWSLAQQASYLQKKAKLTKAATFSIVQVFLRVAEHRGKIHASQPASLDLILGVFHLPIYWVALLISQWTVAINRTHLAYSKWHYYFGNVQSYLYKKVLLEWEGGRGVALLP